MNRKKLPVYPHIEELGYRDKTNPEKLNKMLRSIQESTLRSILRGSEINSLVSNLNLGVSSSYIALAKSVGSLHSYESIPSGSLFATGFDEVNTVNGCRQDAVAGIVTLDWTDNKKFSKIPRYDSDEDGIADTVSPNANIYVDDTLRDSDDESYNCLNRRNDSFWIEQISSGEHSVEIRLPPSLNKNFNYIEVVPFPLFGIDIKKVEYQDIHSNWETLYKKNTKDYVFYDSTGPLVMHVSPKSFNNTIKLTIDVDAEIGVIGFSNIDIGYIDYDDGLQTCYMKFANLPSSAGTVTYTLKKAYLDFYIDGTVKKDKVVSELSIVNATSGGDSVPINKISTSAYDFGGATIDVDSDEDLYLKIVMKENNRTTPVFRGCRLTYEV